MKRLGAQIALLVFFNMFFFGCTPLFIGTAAGVAGTYVWNHGNLELTVDYSVEELYAASRQALDKMNFMVERDRHDHFGANISARTEQGHKVLIKIDGETEFSSRIRARVGVWGNREQSQILLSRILGNV